MTVATVLAAADTAKTGELKFMIFREDCLKRFQSKAFMDAALSFDKDTMKKAFTKSDEECLKFTISKGLGLAIVAGSSILKVP